MRAFNGPFSGTTWVSQYQKGKTNLDFTEARDSEWQWHQQGCIQVCNSLQTENHASTPPLRFLQARCLSCHPTNGVKALKAKEKYITNVKTVVGVILKGKVNKNVLSRCLTVNFKLAAYAWGVCLSNSVLACGIINWDKTVLFDCISSKVHWFANAVKNYTRHIELRLQKKQQNAMRPSNWWVQVFAGAAKATIAMLHIVITNLAVLKTSKKHSKQ